ncbi:MAG TPA: Lrp/AsnC family transcriptional regulator [Nanoarchaeota archaeon]|nr:Lrp/AsnC family transcriptional regulator [Nanoarchaeota archaeon]
MKLNIKDRKILHALDLNSRASLNEIARKAGVSKQVADYRLKRLIRDKIIKQFYTAVNFSKLGYTQYKLYLKFQNAGIAKEHEIIDYWANCKNSAWVASCRGRWDIAVSILAKNIGELGKILDAFNSKYGLFILEKDILITQLSPVFTKAYLAENAEKSKFSYGEKIGDYKLDAIDEGILKVLSSNARITILELMDKSGLTRDIIAYRLKKFAKEGIIRQYRILIDLQKIEHKLYKIMLRLHSLTAEKEKALMAYVAAHPNGVQYLKTAGSWDAELEFEVKDEDEIYALLLEIRAKFSDVIRDCETLLIPEEHKLNYFPF